MSKITSWDKRVTMQVDGNPYVTLNGKRARLVLWPEGAPDPSTVPHAGDTVRSSSQGGVFTVENGIPRAAQYCGAWMLLTNDEHGQFCWHRCKDLTRLLKKLEAKDK